MHGKNPFIGKKSSKKKDNEVKKEEDDNQPKKSLNIHIQALNAAIGKLKPPGYKEQFLSTFTRKVEDYLKQLTECSLPENAIINIQNEADVRKEVEYKLFELQRSKLSLNFCIDFYSFFIFNRNSGFKRDTCV
ncbi:hypothetical protein [Coxiella burnetii]|uniref:hypothetical protein n=1 Tax=Coxiella burnetii TaxID=777 RepID=UPI001E3285F0|nr:hypothetical protein [Coxiella burnetii]